MTMTNTAPGSHPDPDTDDAWTYAAGREKPPALGPRIRYRLTAKLVAQSPLHIGGAGLTDPRTITGSGDRSTTPGPGGGTTGPENSDLDSPGQRSHLALAVNGACEYYIPGTSIAGALRAWCERTWDQPRGHRAIARHWGSLEGASRIVVSDVPLGAVGDSGVGIEVRDGVGIDRVTGTAAHAIRYDREVLPTGTVIDVRLTTEARVGPDGTDQDDHRDDPTLETMLATLVTALTEGVIPLGAATSRGLGSVRAVETTLERLDLATVSGLRAWLDLGDPHDRRNSGDPGDPGAVPVYSRPVPGPAPQRLTITVHWHPALALLVAAGPTVGHVPKGDDTERQVTVPVLTRRGKPGSDPAGADPELVAVLPGSAAKGALRTRATRIARTVLSHRPDEPDSPDPARQRPFELKSFVQDRAEDPMLVRLLFGGADWKSPLRVLDTHATSGVSRGPSDPPSGSPGGTGRQPGTARANTVCDRGGDWFATMVGKLGTPSTQVALDRWTSAPADERLFTILPVQKQQKPKDWDPITIEVDLCRLVTGWPGLGKSWERANAALVLLYLVLAELAAGTLPLGSRATRGLGAVTVTKVEARTRGLAGTADSGTHPWADGWSTNDPAAIVADVLAAARRLLPAGGDWTSWIEGEA